MQTIEHAATNELIVIEQLPVIRERLKLLGAEIDEKIKGALSLACTEETVKTVKVARAKLNKDYGAIEERRTEVKKAVMTPYEQFNDVYKEFVSDKYKAADVALKGKIDSVESELKRRKQDELREWFEEYRLSCGVDFVNMDTWNPNVTLTVTLTALKKDGKAYIDRICDDLKLIDTLEHKSEIMVEYRRSLNASQSITAVTERHKAIEEQARRQAELETRKAAEAEVVKRVEAAIPTRFPAPVMELAEDDPVKTVAFRVTAPLSKLQELRKYLDNGGYEYK